MWNAYRAAVLLSALALSSACTDESAPAQPGGASAMGGGGGAGAGGNAGGAPGGGGSDGGMAGGGGSGGEMLGPFDVLLFSKTAGFRHASISAGVAAVEALGMANDFSVTATEDASTFSASGLESYEVVVFLNTTGDVLDEGQQQAFEGFIQAGGGYVGTHSATDTEYGWPWYGELVGAYFDGHPSPQTATVRIVDSTHPATVGLPIEWERFDEWYNFRALPGPNVTVLAQLDESTYNGGTMGDDHPIAWFHEFQGGRAFYTAGGHTSETFDEPDFRQHLLGAIRWAAGR